MDIFLNIIKCWGLGMLGMSLYAFIKVWGNIKTDRKFDHVKFFTDNKMFWFFGIILHLIISISTTILPESKSLVELGAGIALEHSMMGYVTLGWLLGGGTNKVNGMTGAKKIENSK